MFFFLAATIFSSSPFHSARELREALPIQETCEFSNDEFLFFFLAFDVTNTATKEQLSERKKLAEVSRKLSQSKQNVASDESNGLMLFKIDCSLKTKTCSGAKFSFSWMIRPSPLDNHDLLSIHGANIAFVDKKMAVVKWGVHTFYIDISKKTVRFEAEGSTGNEIATTQCPVR